MKSIIIPPGTFRKNDVERNKKEIKKIREEAMIRKCAIILYKIKNSISKK